MSGTEGISHRDRIYISTPDKRKLTGNTKLRHSREEAVYGDGEKSEESSTVFPFLLQMFCLLIHFPLVYTENPVYVYKFLFSSCSEFVFLHLQR